MQVVDQPDALEALVARALGAERLALDLEATGTFAYHPTICVAQLAWDDEVAVVDVRALPASSMARLLGAQGPVKIVHDVGFDARLLAEKDVELGNVHDTALAARMLGRTATGLASLLEAELGVRIGKELQQHDWRIRPFDARMLTYLASDVVHLRPLETRLWDEVRARGIEPEVEEETRYRIASSIEAARTPRLEPAYLRIKGIDRASDAEKAVLLSIADLREREAERRDVPLYKVVSTEVLLAVARKRPRTAADVARIHGFPSSTAGARRFAEEVAAAVAAAPDTLPDEERARFLRPRVSGAESRARRSREARLAAWRREEASKRGVDEQVVLPGHCLKDVVEANVSSVEALGQIAGIGAFRVERDGPAIVLALKGPSETL